MHSAIVSETYFFISLCICKSSTFQDWEGECAHEINCLYVLILKVFATIMLQTSFVIE